ncbi:uncharacterized protein M6B38_277165 [Iris pallida]|uniref:Uncharacterized protein n=1 Tax=Iris pallida TaxID=29817 RepID=A0AAX6I2H7_IRIPA|nr:uncharacterized protein M6B38_132655 [Iris pallida]KAJ6847520.1 uncharacterized protein M6B38_277165 [Iris pallida]
MAESDVGSLESTPTWALSIEHAPHLLTPVFATEGQEAVNATLEADFVVLNTDVAGKWLDIISRNMHLKLFQRFSGGFMKYEVITSNCVKHLPFVAGAMIDSHKYWKNGTHGHLEYAISTI